MNGMRTASKDFGDLVADVMKEIQFERGKADPQINKNTKSQAAIVFLVDDPILAASHQQTALVWNRIGEHMLSKAHEVMTHDRPIKYLSRQYLKVHTHGRRGFKVRLPQEYCDSTATAMELVGCGSGAVPGCKKSGPTVGQVGQDQRTLGANDHSRYRVGKLQFMINEVQGIANAVKKLVKTIGGTVRAGHARPETVCTVHAGTQRRVAIPDSARQASEARRGGNDRSVH